MLLGEERLKETLKSVIADFNERGLSIGTEYYVLKDVLLELEKVYYDYVNENREKVNQEINQELAEGLTAAFNNNEKEEKEE